METNEVQTTAKPQEAQSEASEKIKKAKSFKKLAKKEKIISKPRAKSCLVIGSWSEDKKIFTVGDKQPESPISNIVDMARWAKTAYELDGGSFNFVRTVTGSLRMEKQTVFKFYWAS
jgi:hypothetical protein